jgi:hypothetical protein
MKRGIINGFIMLEPKAQFPCTPVLKSRCQFQTSGPTTTCAAVSTHPNQEPNQLLVSFVPSSTFLSNLSTAELTSRRVLFSSRSACAFASSYFFLASTLYWSNFCSAFCASVLAWLAWRC